MLFSLMASAQQLRYGSGGTVYNEQNDRLNSNEVRGLLINKKKALKLYEEGRNKKSWGNFFFYGGLTLATTNLVLAAIDRIEPVTNPNGTQGYEFERAGPALAILGCVFVLVSIPINRLSK